MIIVVTGGRGYARAMPDKPPEQTAQEAADLAHALDLTHARRPATALVHGDGKGADKASGEWAAMRGVYVRSVPVDHALDGPWPAAGPKRNARTLAEAQEMADLLSETNPLGVVAFPGGRGTADMVRRCEAAGLKVWRPYG